MSHHHTPVWRYTENGPTIRVGHRADPVPEPLWARLVDPSGAGVSADPAKDLMVLEACLRRVIAELVDKVGTADRDVVVARAEVEDSAAPRRLFRTVRRRLPRANLTSALQRHTATVALLQEARGVQRALRQFVIDLDLPSGLLAEAAVGWRRGDGVPSGVVVFEDEDSFLTVDTRRACSDWGFAGAAADIYGRQWRRDSDDDPFADPPGHGGTWTLGHIPRTGEIYAARYGDHRQVWLLGRGFMADRARPLLTGLESRMREPNSIVFAADTVHAARLQPASLQDRGSDASVDDGSTGDDPGNPGPTSRAVDVDRHDAEAAG